MVARIAGARQCAPARFLLLSLSLSLSSLQPKRTAPVPTIAGPFNFNLIIWLAAVCQILRAWVSGRVLLRELVLRRPDAWPIGSRVLKPTDRPTDRPIAPMPEEQLWMRGVWDGARCFVSCIRCLTCVRFIVCFTFCTRVLKSTNFQCAKRKYVSCRKHGLHLTSEI